MVSAATPADFPARLEMSRIDSRNRGVPLNIAYRSVHSKRQFATTLSGPPFGCFDGSPAAATTLQTGPCASDPRSTIEKNDRLGFEEHREQRIDAAGTAMPAVPGTDAAIGSVS